MLQVSLATWHEVIKFGLKIKKSILIFERSVRYDILLGNLVSS